MCKTRNVNEHISGGPTKRNHTKKKKKKKKEFNIHLMDIISNLQLTVTKNTQAAGANEEND